MDLNYRCSIAALIALSMLITIDCGSPEAHNRYPTERYKDIYEALKYMHKYLPDHMPLDERCKRYAVLFTMSETHNKPHQMAVNQLLALHKDILDTIYKIIDNANLISHLKTVIDRYTTTKLDPPLFDLVECLRQIDSSLIGTYRNQELTNTIKLYAKILERRLTLIDLNEMDMSGFHPTIKATFMRLLEGTDDKRSRSGQESILESNHMTKGSKNIENEDHEMIEAALEKQRQRHRLVQRRFRQRHLERVREKDRVRKRMDRAVIMSLAAKRFGMDQHQVSQEAQSEQMNPIVVEKPKRIRTDRIREQDRERQRRYRQRNLDLYRENQRGRQRKRRAESLHEYRLNTTAKHSDDADLVPEELETRFSPMTGQETGGVGAAMQYQELQKLRLQGAREPQRQFKLQSITKKQRRNEPRRSQIHQDPQRINRQRQSGKNDRERTELVEVVDGHAEPESSRVLESDNATAHTTSTSLSQLVDWPIFASLPPLSYEEPWPTFDLPVAQQTSIIHTDMSFKRSPPSRAASRLHSQREPFNYIMDSGLEDEQTQLARIQKCDPITSPDLDIYADLSGRASELDDVDSVMRAFLDEPQEGNSSGLRRNVNYAALKRKQ